MNSITYRSPIGVIVIREEDEMISEIQFTEKSSTIEKPSDLLLQAVGQLDEYFKGSRNVFNLPLRFSATPFQMKVYQALMAIPYGATASYADIARMIGKPKAYRAVGMANNRNRLPIIVPCHRVVGSDGALVGYASGLSIKQYLLDLERNNR